MSTSSRAGGRLATLTAHVQSPAAGDANDSDVALAETIVEGSLPDIGAPGEAYARDRMMEETTQNIMYTMTAEGAARPLFSDPLDLVRGWGTVTRGDPPAHQLPPEQLAEAGLTEDTWMCDVEADPFVDYPHVRSAATIDTPLELDLATLERLGLEHGTVKVMKAMQCLNVDSPLGQGVWEVKQTSFSIKLRIR